MPEIQIYATQLAEAHFNSVFLIGLQQLEDENNSPVARMGEKLLSWILEDVIP